MDRINVYDPVFLEEDALAAYDAVKSGILSSFGPEVKALESNFASYLGSKYALSCSSGTAGLYLALAPFIKPGDIVAVPTLSYAATAFSIIHHNAQVEFIDADKDTWNLDLNHLEKLCREKPIKAVIAVHNYGNPLDMTKLMELSQKYGFIVVEDACEAITSMYDNKMIGSIGHIGVFSFYGNKFLATAGEGGLVVTNNEQYYERMKLEHGQGQDPNRRFWHLIPGHNFRLTNLQAAVINSQFKRRDTTIARKRQIYERYRDHLDDDLIWQEVPINGQHCYWMISVRHWEEGWYKKAEQYLSINNIETRPIFPPIHTMPACKQDVCLPNSERICDTGITIPSGLAITNEQIDRVCSVINEII